ncbi:MAG: carbohydrate ABC transporter permease, partial [Thermomicrobiales bacterium]
PQLWLASTSQVLPSLAIVYIWARFGFGMLIFIAGLEGISLDYYDAAAIDGATKFQTIRHITIPLLNRQFILVALLETVSALKVFDVVYAATQGGPGDASRTTVMYVYETAFTLFEFGRASVAALTLFLLIVVITLVQRRILGREND